VRILVKFQSTPPRGGRLGIGDAGKDSRRFQSTPPRGGRPARPWRPESTRQVSIHAPARGAT